MHPIQKASKSIAWKKSFATATLPEAKKIQSKSSKLKQRRFEKDNLLKSD